MLSLMPTESYRLTVTVKLAVPVLALESVAVQVTRVRPMWKALPEAGLQVAGTGPSTSSCAAIA